MRNVRLALAATTATELSVSDALRHLAQCCVDGSGSGSGDGSLLSSVTAGVSTRSDSTGGNGPVVVSDAAASSLGASSSGAGHASHVDPGDDHGATVTARLTSATTKSAPTHATASQLRAPLTHSATAATTTTTTTITGQVDSRGGTAASAAATTTTTTTPTPSVLSARAVDAVLAFARAVDGAERSVDVLSAFADAWPVLRGLGDRIDAVRAKVQSAQLSDATAGDRSGAVSKMGRQLWRMARGAVAHAEKAFSVAVRVVYCGRRKPSASGCLVKGLRALLGASPTVAGRQHGSGGDGGGGGGVASGGAAGAVLPSIAAFLPQSRLFPELVRLQHAVRRAESIVDQTAGACRGRGRGGGGKKQLAWVCCWGFLFLLLLCLMGRGARGGCR